MKFFENDGTGPHGRMDEDGSQHQGCGSRSAHRESKRRVSRHERRSCNKSQVGNVLTTANNNEGGSLSKI